MLEGTGGGNLHLNLGTIRDIFALPGELSRAILENTGANVGNLQLNRMALVCRLWYNVLAPPADACMPVLTRRVTLGEADMLAVAQIAQTWWRWLKGKEDVTDAGLANLAAGCPVIAYLNLHSCHLITDTGLASLAAGCTALTTLDLSFCPGITDVGLASLAVGCRAITTLSLYLCVLITDAGLASIAAGWPAITSLNLSHCPDITDAGLASLAAGCTALTSLNLSFCKEITERVLRRLDPECIAITTFHILS